jgi:hypothetical protein
VQYDVEIRVIEREANHSTIRRPSKIGASLPTEEEALALPEYLITQAQAPRPFGPGLPVVERSELNSGVCSFCAGYPARWNRSQRKVMTSNCRFPSPRPVLTVGTASVIRNIPERAVEMMGLLRVQLKDSNEIENEILPLIEQDH